MYYSLELRLLGCVRAKYPKWEDWGSDDGDDDVINHQDRIVEG
jgi:hypothetical protein